MYCSCIITLTICISLTISFKFTRSFTYLLELQHAFTYIQWYSYIFKNNSQALILNIPPSLREINPFVQGQNLRIKYYLLFIYHINQAEILITYDYDTRFRASPNIRYSRRICKTLTFFI